MSGPGNIDNDSLLDNIGAGLYEVTVTDDSLCAGSSQFNISDINAPIVTDSTVDITCNNNTDGKIFLTVTTQPLGNTYGIDWDIDNFIGATPPDLDGLQDSIVQTDLPAGVYFVRVTDSSNNCLTVHDATVNDPGPIVLAPLSSDSASCNGLATGSASVGGITGITGGNGGYNYTWANALTPLVDLGQNNDTAFNLIAGDYNIKVEDIKGCSDSGTIAVLEPNLLVIGDSGKTDVTCFGLSDGKAWVVESSITGGNGGYTYLWDDPLTQTTDTANALNAGFYNIIVF